MLGLPAGEAYDKATVSDVHTEICCHDTASSSENILKTTAPQQTIQILTPTTNINTSQPSSLGGAENFTDENNDVMGNDENNDVYVEIMKPESAPSLLDDASESDQENVNQPVTRNDYRALKCKLNMSVRHVEAFSKNNV
ncbi:unnamed protein product [Lactuca virosa]|uniref:Uncharacterized protein n=1 Tax=Lactuca virosa TaxID=75947 RepID=A0AAU9N0L6_9ASTR|nr:unnamed protein product [Lactuca virosa]